MQGVFRIGLSAMTQQELHNGIVAVEPDGCTERKLPPMLDEGHPGLVHMRTAFGGVRIVDMLVGEQLPRIC